jgi:hypothetical protein
MPDITKEQLAEAVRADVRAQMGWDKAQEWQHHDVPDEYTPEELARVTALQSQWEALSEQGQKEGWLEFSGGHLDGEWETASNHKHPTRTISVRESEEARTRRLHVLNEAVELRTFNRVATEWKHLLKAEGIIARLGK